MEYQSVMQIVTECLFGWDDKNKKGNGGILGTLEAFIRGDEEQGRGSNHGHWLLWVSGFNDLRKMLRLHSSAIREKAKE